MRSDESMTDLNASERVPKDHPRILLRGKLDSLAAELLILQCTSGEALAAALEDALCLDRAILCAEVLEEALPAYTLGGMDAEAVHDASHHPERYGFPGHILLTRSHGASAAQLNRLRALCREAECAAVTAFRTEEGYAHEDCIVALNRLSAYLYVLTLREAEATQP